jgi:hypothetical protein
LVLMPLALLLFRFQLRQRPPEEPSSVLSFPVKASLSGASLPVNRKVPSPDLPPVGRSLFDFVTTEQKNGEKVQSVPFPFTALLKRIAHEVGGDDPPSPPFKVVLIPLGRSLQRNAAAPQFFKFPRVVVAVDSEPESKSGAGKIFLKDRLYLGYLEKANIIEVISYNEAAGRFEFQIVKNYRAGAKPEVVYASRGLCVSCHQNESPIFSRPVWAETNANPAIAALIGKRNSSSYDVAVEQAVDVPNAIDNASHRANLYSVAQLLWREGCEGTGDERTAIRCRANAFVAVLQYLLSGKRQFDFASEKFRGDFWAPFVNNVQKKWLQGLGIPNPELPNRNPLSPLGESSEYVSKLSALEKLPTSELVRLADVTPPFDPLDPRPPLRIWPAPRGADETVSWFIDSLALFIARKDIQRLNAYLNAREGKPATLSVNKAAKMAGGSSKADSHEKAALRVAGNFRIVRAAIDQLVNDAIEGKFDGFSSKPFRRAILMSALDERLGMPARDWCCTDDRGMPVPKTGDAPQQNGSDNSKAAQADPAIKLFYRDCVPCHRTPEPTPPNFLFGDSEPVRSALAQCAERIYFRLDMWRLDPEDRPKTPMPPARDFDGLRLSEQKSFQTANLDKLKDYVATLLRNEKGQRLDLEQFASRSYPQLRSCLAEEAG